MTIQRRAVNWPAVDFPLACRASYLRPAFCSPFRAWPRNRTSPNAASSLPSPTHYQQGRQRYPGTGCPCPTRKADCQNRLRLQSRRQRGRSRDYGPCLDLADAINQLNTRTIAFVHSAALRHTVLPILACQELVMSSDAVLGPVVADKDGSLNDLKRGAYKRLARKGQEALIQKMFDRDVAVLEGRLNNGVVYLDARKRTEAERSGVVGVGPQAILPAGTVKGYTTDEALRYGLCQARLESKQEVAERFGCSHDFEGRSAAGPRRQTLAPQGSGNDRPRFCRNAAAKIDRRTPGWEHPLSGSTAPPAATSKSPGTSPRNCAS